MNGNIGGNIECRRYSLSVLHQKRSLKKLKVADHNDCTTSELLDKFADDDDNDLANDPDFEVGATDLVTETEEEEEDVDEEENSEPEEDTVRVRFGKSIENSEK